MSKVVFLTTIPCQQNWYSFGLTFRPNWLKNVKKIIGRTTWTDNGKDEEKPDQEQQHTIKL